MALASAFSSTTVGLDIGSSSVRAVALRRSRAGWALVAAREAAINHTEGPGACTVEPLAVSEAICQVFEQMPVRRPRIAAALTGHAVIVKRLTLPAMSPAALAEAMPGEVEPYIPFDMADVQLDYQVLDAGGSSADSARGVLFVAAKKDRIEDRISLIRQAGQRASVLDVEAFALANAYEMNYADHTDDLTALLHVGRSGTVVCLLERAQPVFTRDIAIGGRVYGEALQRELAVDAETAEHMKSGRPSEHGHQVFGVLRDTSAQLVLDVRKTVDFYKVTAPVEKVSRVVLSGGACEAAGLTELLGAEFGAPVELLDPFRRITRRNVKDGAPGAALGPAYAVAVGLAVRREGDR